VQLRSNDDQPQTLADLSWSDEAACGVVVMGRAAARSALERIERDAESAGWPVLGVIVGNRIPGRRLGELAESEEVDTEVVITTVSTTPNGKVPAMTGPRADQRSPESGRRERGQALHHNSVVAA
jgi:hypothetical protein